MGTNATYIKFLFESGALSIIWMPFFWHSTLAILNIQKYELCKYFKNNLHNNVFET
jgi:hypothetical protein